MRIMTDQSIAGYPAVQVRKLLRETIGRSIPLRYVREILRCSDAAASRVLNRLQKDGFVELVQGHFEPTTKGSALAMATAAPPLRRETAARLIADLTERARALNADERWAYRVGMVVVFGSYVRGVDRPNDVDIACELRPRWTGEKQLAQEQVRREIRGEPFRNMSEWATWPGPGPGICEPVGDAPGERRGRASPRLRSFGSLETRHRATHTGRTRLVRLQSPHSVETRMNKGVRRLHKPRYDIGNQL
jgi:predicted nucleotidyltransferase